MWLLGKHVHYRPNGGSLRRDEALPRHSAGPHGPRPAEPSQAASLHGTPSNFVVVGLNARPTSQKPSPAGGGLSHMTREVCGGEIVLLGLDPSIHAATTEPSLQVRERHLAVRQQVRPTSTPNKDAKARHRPNAIALPASGRGLGKGGRSPSTKPRTTCSRARPRSLRMRGRGCLPRKRVGLRVAWMAGGMSEKSLLGRRGGQVVAKAGWAAWRWGGCSCGCYGKIGLA